METKADRAPIMANNLFILPISDAGSDQRDCEHDRIMLPWGRPIHLPQEIYPPPSLPAAEGAGRRKYRTDL